MDDELKKLREIKNSCFDWPISILCQISKNLTKYLETCKVNKWRHIRNNFIKEEKTLADMIDFVHQESNFHHFVNNEVYPSGEASWDSSSLSNV